MNWASWSDFLAMGGYAVYVWGSYGLTAGLIVVEIVQAILNRRETLARTRGFSRAAPRS